MNKTDEPSLLRRVVENPLFRPYVVLVALIIFSSIASPKIFPTYTNIMNILRQASIVGVVSIGMTLVLLIGGIDLSVTSVMAMTACLLSDMFKAAVSRGATGIQIGPILLVLAIGCFIGMCNGLLVISRNLEPFIVTLGMNQVVKGIVMVYRKGSPGGTVTEFWKNFGSSNIFGVPKLAVMYLVLMAIFIIILSRTVFGRHVYAIGSNAEAARLTGIKVTQMKVLAYVLCGFTAAIAGIMLVARVRVGEPNGSSGYDMDALAAAVIGGTSMSGGIGNLIGTLAGVLIMAIMNNILNLIGANPNLQGVIKGVIILIAVLTQRKDK